MMKCLMIILMAFICCLAGCSKYDTQVDNIKSSLMELEVSKEDATALQEYADQTEAYMSTVVANNVKASDSSSTAGGGNKVYINVDIDGSLRVQELTLDYGKINAANQQQLVFGTSGSRRIAFENATDELKERTLFDIRGRILTDLTASIDTLNLETDDAVDSVKQVRKAELAVLRSRVKDLIEQWGLASSPSLYFSE